jgi:hypothetical protein
MRHEALLCIFLFGVFSKTQLMSESSNPRRGGRNYVFWKTLFGSTGQYGEDIITDPSFSQRVYGMLFRRMDLTGTLDTIFKIHKRSLSTWVLC